MKKVRVVLTPMKTDMQVPASNKQTAKYTVVDGVTIKLVAKGPPGSAVTADAKPAKFELLELPGTQDATKKPRVLFALDGEINDNGGTPFLDSGPNSPTLLVRRNDSDFRLELQFDNASFNVPAVNNVLRLPWESSTENNQIEVGARLTVDGTVEADIQHNDKLDVPMKHRAVPDDGTNTSQLSDCVGVRTVYPTRHDFLKPGTKVGFAGKTMNIFIHEDVGKRTNELKATSYAFTSVVTHVEAIMKEAGFATLSITEVKDSDPALKAIWTKRAGKVIAQNVGTADPETDGVTDTDGTDIPFFDSWVFMDRVHRPKSDEAADSEMRNPDEKTRVNLTAKTKRLIRPIVIYGRSNEAYANSIDATKASEVPKLVASLICHEIGHGLGLLHGLNFDRSSKVYTKAKETGTMTMLRTDAQGNAFEQLFGPVHKDLFKTFYL